MYFGLLVIVFIFGSCDVSTFSNTDVVDLDKLNVIINIQNSNKTSKRGYLKVKLSDGNKQIINKNIHVLLNNIPLDLYVKDNLYYTKTSYYKTDRVLNDSAYYFEIILPDSTRYPLAFIKPRVKDAAVKFTIPEHITSKEELVLTWEQLKTPHQLQLVNEKKYHVMKNTIEYGYVVKPIDTLTQKKGAYVISKPSIGEPITIEKEINVVLSRKEVGLMNAQLLKNSSITYHQIIQKTVVIKP